MTSSLESLLLIFYDFIRNWKPTPKTNPVYQLGVIGHGMSEILLKTSFEHSQEIDVIYDVMNSILF